MDVRHFCGHHAARKLLPCKQARQKFLIAGAGISVGLGRVWVVCKVSVCRLPHPVSGLYIETLPICGTARTLRTEGVCMSECLEIVGFDLGCTYPVSSSQSRTCHLGAMPLGTSASHRVGSGGRESAKTANISMMIHDIQ